MLPTLWRSNGGSLATERAHPLEQFRREFDTLFDRFFGGFPAPFEPEFGPMRWWDFGVEDQGNEVVVRAELPGFEEKDLDVQLHDNLLVAPLLPATVRWHDRAFSRGRNHSDRKLVQARCPLLWASS